MMLLPSPVFAFALSRRGTNDTGTVRSKYERERERERDVFGREKAGKGRQEERWRDEQGEWGYARERERKLLPWRSCFLAALAQS